MAPPAAPLFDTALASDDTGTGGVRAGRPSDPMERGATSGAHELGSSPDSGSSDLKDLLEVKAISRQTSAEGANTAPPALEGAPLKPSLLDADVADEMPNAAAGAALEAS